MSFRAITGTMLSSTGAPARGEVILRRVRTGWTPDDLYLPDEVRLEADADGNVVPGLGYTGYRPVVDGVPRAQVWASEGSDRQSLYEITVTGPMVSGGIAREVIATIAVPTGSTPLTLQQILELGSPEGSESYETVLTFLSGLWRGEWSATPDPAYARGSLVQNDGSVWIALVDGTTQEPTGAATQWDLYAAKGDPGTGEGGADLSDDLPLALGTASAGVSSLASRSDHVHTMPSAGDVGADPEGTASSAVSGHNAATESVHGITDTAALETQVGAQAKVDAHADLTDNPHGVTASQAGADPAGTASTAVSTHNAAADAHGVRLPPTPVGQADGRILTVATDALVYGDAPSGGATAKNSVEIDAGDLQLVGDAASPGNSRYYGTSSAGTKGFHELPVGGGGVTARERVAMPMNPRYMTVFDDFERADGALGTADSGHTWTEAGSAGGIVVDSGRAVQALAGGISLVDYSAALGAGVATNVEIGAECFSNARTQGPGLVLLWSDIDNYVYVILEDNGKAARIYKRLSAVNTLLSSAAIVPFDSSNPDTSKIPFLLACTIMERQDGSVRVTVDARTNRHATTSLATVLITDSAEITLFARSRSCGLRGAGNNVRWNSFYVRAFP